MIQAFSNALLSRIHLFALSSINKLLRCALFIITLVCACSLSVIAQQDSAQVQVDTGVASALSKYEQLRERMKKYGEEERIKSIETYNQDRNTIRQDEIISEIKKITRQAIDFAKANIDSAEIWQEYLRINELYDIAGDGIFTNAGTSQTHRNLTTTANIIKELLAKSRKQKQQVDTFRKQLVSYNFLLDSLGADSVLYDFPSDSAAFTTYLSNLLLASQEIGPADSALKKAIANVQDLQIALSLQVSKLAKAAEVIEDDRKSLSDEAFHREFSNIWGNVGYSRPVKDIARFSRLKGLLVLRYYSVEHVGKIFVCVIVIILLIVFLRSVKRSLAASGGLQTDFTGQLVFRYPVYSAIMIGLNFMQFIFPPPPFIFSTIFWVISATCLTIIFWGYITRFWMTFWLLMCVFFVLACANNLLLQASRPERWWMIVLSVAGVVIGTYFLLKGHKQELREKSILYFIGFVVVLEFFSVIANLFGRYNLSKTLLTSGYVNVIVAIQFLWTVRLLDEVLSVASRVYNKTEKRLLYFNFEKVGHKVPPLFYLLLIIGWFVLFGRNFYAFTMITGPFEEMLMRNRAVGDYSFSIYNALLFVVIMLLATITSKVVSFFASDMPGAIPDRNSSKSKVGSWLLLIRISIISCGLFFASAAAGIPFDRITLILGALGVGIGFGLQQLTNSLVSGLIIAFEKPVNVGDIVEVDGQSGTMKSIGFRSSVIRTWEGADVIIPNGTLLSSNLINWTMSDDKRRVDFAVGVAYGTDLENARQILLEILEADSRILKYPNPAVQLIEFNNSSIDMRVYFWVVRIQEWVATRSDVIIAIDLAFKKHGIVIPFPQQDIYIHNLDPVKGEEDKDIPVPPNETDNK